MAAAVAGAVMSGVAMFAVGARAPQADAFVDTPALVQTLDGQYVAAARPVSYGTALQPVATPVVQRRSAAALRRTVYRDVEPVREREVVRDEAQPRRSWTKTGLIIG